MSDDGAPRTAWLKDARFGLFIHWGIYSVPARQVGKNSLAEWIKSREQLSDRDYDLYFDHFDPDLFDPEGWAREAADAGMRYVVVTTKHHDGFCLWDSAFTRYKAPNTPAGRDLLRPLVEAFRSRGLKVGFYHSLIDWHHPEFPLDGFHPQRNDEELKRDAAGRDIAKYRAYLHGQVRELLTGYGRVDYIFFDFSYGPGLRPEIWGGKGPDEWGSDELLDMVRQLQPGIVVNDRLGLPGDVTTPEQYQPASPLPLHGGQSLWEGEQTLNGSWGYDRDNAEWKPPEMLVQMLVDGVSKDGNLLLNVGPTARGELDDKALELLREIGKWMRRHNGAIYGCGPAPFTAPPDCRYTSKGNRLFLHVFCWPFGHLHLSGLAGHVQFARFLHDGSEVQREEVDPAQVPNTVRMAGLPPGTLTLKLPVRRPDVLVPVIELFLRD
ncbi:MAG TPA: alpha-L-fucosidase [Acidimicrobiales bacterium]|nr:alpha-L-fucosidase [Acidimicrobiales bacterium]